MNGLLVLCQNCLNQLDVNKQSLIREHCSIVTVCLSFSKKSHHFSFFRPFPKHANYPSLLPSRSYCPLKTFNGRPGQQNYGRFSSKIWNFVEFRHAKLRFLGGQFTQLIHNSLAMIIIVYGSILRPSGNN
jgi:hypothetical protein